MPLLNELTNEILYQIIDQIDPADICMFSRSCSRFRQLTEGALALHKDRKRRYGYNSVLGCRRHKDGLDPLQLMYDIYMDWKVEYYVRRLDVQWCSHPRDTGLIADCMPEMELDEEGLRSYKAEKKSNDDFNERFMELLQGSIEETYKKSGSPYTTRLPVDKVCSDIKTGDRSAMVALLLWFIPHLEVLCLSQRAPDSLYLYDAIKKMTEQGHTKSGACKPLTKLIKVQILGSEGGATDEQFDNFAPFMALPSMKLLHGNFVRGQIERPVMWAHLPLHASNVTVISFKNSAVRVECFRLMLTAIKSLKEFSYDCTEGDHLEANKIIAALHEHAKHSLEYLWLRGSVNHFMEDVIPSRSIRGFEVLKRCRIPTATYPGFLSRPWIPRDGRLILEKVQPLVYALPPSIEELNLCYSGSYPRLGHASGFLDHFAEEKEQRLPLLKVLRIQEHWERRPYNEHSAMLATEMCAKVGVTLKTDWSGMIGGDL